MNYHAKFGCPNLKNDWVMPIFLCILTSATPPRCHTPFEIVFPIFAEGQSELPCKIWNSSVQKLLSYDHFCVYSQVPRPLGGKPFWNVFPIALLPLYLLSQKNWNPSVQKWLSYARFSVYSQVPRPLGATPLLKKICQFLRGVNVNYLWKMTKIWPIA